jgi:hypothetical protein
MRLVLNRFTSNPAGLPGRYRRRVGQSSFPYKDVLNLLAVPIPNSSDPCCSFHSDDTGYRVSR